MSTDASQPDNLPVAPAASAAAAVSWVVLVMGVAGCGKTSLGKLLAEQTNARFIEADDFHSEANIAKMSAGEALTDTDRAGWLLALNETLRSHAAEAAARGDTSRQVLACSALKETYRGVLACGLEHFVTVYLEGDIGAIAPRLQQRPDHFMPVSLLESQFATLEPPADALVIAVSKPLGQAASMVRDYLAGQGLLPDQ